MPHFLGHPRVGGSVRSWLFLADDTFVVPKTGWYQVAAMGGGGSGGYDEGGGGASGYFKTAAILLEAGEFVLVTVGDGGQSIAAMQSNSGGQTAFGGVYFM